MPFVRIIHTTEYRYMRPVRLLAHRLMLRPRDSHDLWLVDATLTMTPPAARTRWAHDVFGNSICHLEPVSTPTDFFSVVSRLELEHFPASPDRDRGKLGRCCNRRRAGQ